MTAAEMIERLSELPPDAEVMCWPMNWESDERDPVQTVTFSGGKVWLEP